MTGQGGKSGENRKAPAATDVHSLQRTIHWSRGRILARVTLPQFGGKCSVLPVQYLPAPSFNVHASQLYHWMNFSGG